MKSTRTFFILQNIEKHLHTEGYVFSQKTFFREASESEDHQKVFLLEIPKEISKLHLERSSLAVNGTSAYLRTKTDNLYEGYGFFRGRHSERYSFAIINLFGRSIRIYEKGDLSESLLSSKSQATVFFHPQTGNKQYLLRYLQNTKKKICFLSQKTFEKKLLIAKICRQSFISKYRRKCFILQNTFGEILFCH